MYTHYSSTPQPQPAPQPQPEEDDGPWVWCQHLRFDELDLTLDQIREIVYLARFIGTRAAAPEPPIIDDDPHPNGAPQPPIYYRARNGQELYQ